MPKLKRVLRNTWGFVRQILSIRGLLDWLGWKQAVGGFIMTGGIVVWSYIRHLSGPNALLLGLATMALVVILWRALTFEPQRLRTPNEVKPTADLAGGPEVVVDYSFEEKKRWEALNTRNTDPSAPLILRNISLTDAAYNVRILPLTIEDEIATFEPCRCAVYRAPGEKGSTYESGRWFATLNQVVAHISSPVV